MDTQSDYGRYKKPQAPLPEVKDNNFKKQGVDHSKKKWPVVKETEYEDDPDIDDGSQQSE